MAVVFIALTIGFLVINLATEWWPAPVLRIPGQLIGAGLPGRASVVPFILGLGALAAAMAVLASACAAARGLRRRLGLAVLGLLGIEIGFALIGVGNLSVVLFPSSDVAPRTLGIVSVVASVALIALPDRLADRASLPALLAAVPSVAALLVIPFLAGLSGSVPLEVADPKWPDRIEGLALAAGVLAGLSTVVAGLIGVFFVFQSVVAARGLRRQVGTAVGRWVDRTPVLLAGVLGAKIGWLATGYLGLLPGAIVGKTADAWSRARSDDLLGVLFGLAIVLIIGAWLLRGARPVVSDDGIRGATALMVGGFFLPFILSSLALLLLTLMNEPPQRYESMVPAEASLLDCGSLMGSGSALALCFVRAFSGLIQPAGLLTYVVALCLTIWLYLRRSHRPLAFALAVILVWITPTALRVAREVIQGGQLETIGKPELLTMDALITLLVIVLLVGWWTGRQRTVGPGALAVILVSSTLIANAGALVPAAGEGVVIGAILVAGALYGFVFESADLNRPGRDRAELVARTLGLQLLGLAFIVLAIAFDSYKAGGADLAELFVPPIVAILIGSQLSHAHRVRIGTRTRSPDPVRTIAAVAIGAVGLAVVLAIASLVPSAPASSPTAVAYAEFLEHVDATRSDLRQKAALALLAAGDTVLGDPRVVDFQTGIAAEKAWIESSSPAPCFSDEHERWGQSVAALAMVGDGLFEPDLEARINAYFATDKLLDAGRSPCQTVAP